MYRLKLYDTYGKCYISGTSHNQSAAYLQLLDYIASGDYVKGWVERRESGVWVEDTTAYCTFKKEP